MTRSWDIWEEPGEISTKSEKRCSVCQEVKAEAEFYQRRKFPLCKKCGREARIAGKTIKIKASVPSEVTSVKDFIDFSSWRLGCKPKDFKSNSIIISCSGYSIRDLAETVEWCASNGKHPDEPWKVMFWVDEYLSSKNVKTISMDDPIERRLQDVYSSADPELRKRIRAVAGKPDKRPALALLREING